MVDDAGDALNARGQGYLSSAYAESFSEFGEPVRLARSRGWLLLRRVPGSDHRDAMGPYPVFCCDDWEALADDLRTLPADLASVCLVTDPFGHHTESSLRNAFDLVRPYKERFVAALQVQPDSFISRHHRKCAEKGLARLDVELCANPLEHLDEWIALYAQVCRRHGISDIRAFSAESFHRQLATPGLVMFRARSEGRTVAIHLWVAMGSVAYGHLAGHDEEAYRLNAAYALYWFALHWFWKRVEFLDLGAAADSGKRAGDGLAFFKRGWSNQTRTSLLCGRVTNASIYQELSANKHADQQDYFPAYRAPSAPSHLN